MTSRLSRTLARRSHRQAPTPAAEQRFGLDRLAELIGSSVNGKITGAAFATWAEYLAENPVVMSAHLERLAMFRQARFAFQTAGSELITDHPALGILETPWPEGSSSDLLARMELDASAAGNSFIYRNPVDPGRLHVWEPASVQIVRERLETPDGRLISEHTAGYLYTDPAGAGKKPIVALVSNGELAHYAPIADPRKPWRGMSWIEPGRLDVVADDFMTRHRLKYFENAATPNLIIKSAANLTDEQYEALEERLEERHAGIDNAYRALIIEGAVEVSALGNSFDESKFSQTQDAGEGRIILASRVPAPLVGIQLGANPTYNNHASARRQFADAWARPAWQSACQALEPLVEIPPAARRLWYQDRHISALQQDAADSSKIAQTDAATIRSLIDAGFEPESVVAAIRAGYDWTQLVHTGRVSVQLLDPNIDPE